MTFQDHIAEAQRVFAEENPNRKLLVCYLSISDELLTGEDADAVATFVSDEVGARAEKAARKLIEANS